MISIITPWKNGIDLLPDYAAAVQGCEVVTVDNGSDTETAQALAQAGGIYIRNEQNVGFAAANNQGYARASGDIIIFLNSDVAPAGPWLAMVEANVKDGALYGPSMAQQLIAGRWLPYLEGWCIAATRGTWEKVGVWFENAGFTPQGTAPMLYPWDAAAYPGPYWEDNDLCLRALLAGISLVQTAWPIQHKGGRTAGNLVNHAESIERNRATFASRVVAAYQKGEPPTPTYGCYMQHVHTQSDIQHHLPLLYSLARGNVVELGTRSGVSTAAFLAGVEKRGGYVWSVDIDPNCVDLYKDNPRWAFFHGSSIDKATVVQIMRHLPNLAIDVLFIDTDHTYEQASAELALWSEYMRPGSVILMHDPETFPGVRRAAEEFAEAKGWPMTVVLPCNGMVIIDVPQYEVVGCSTEGAAWAMEGVAAV